MPFLVALKSTPADDDSKPHYLCRNEAVRPSKRWAVRFDTYEEAQRTADAKAGKRVAAWVEEVA